MSKKILIDAKYKNEIRTVLVNKNNLIEEIECETSGTEQIKGNVYLAKVSRIEPALQAAFITFEDGKSGFLPFFEIHPDFFILPENKKTAIALKELKVPEVNPEEIGEYNEKSQLADPEVVDISILESRAADKNSIKVDLESMYDEIEDIKTQYQNLYKKYKIQEVIKKGQIMLVQAQKEQRGNKAASFTTFLSLAGKFCVLMPNTPKQNGVSRRIINQEERKRLKNIVSSIVTEENVSSSSLIVRTAGIDRSSYEIKKDYEYLAKIWNKIRDAAIKMTAPNTLHIEEAIITKTIRDMLDDKVSEVVIQGHEHYNEAIEFVRSVSPSTESKIVEHKSPEPIFTTYGLEEQILSLYQPIVTLPSGGYIVINPTEALTSIDVNSGKAIGEKHIEETALKTNIEAAMQIAKQIKLRSISGLIVVDFIDMYENKNRRIVENTFKELLSKDRARVQVSNISNLGLMEVSRQRLKPSFLERYSSTCQYCSGKGLVRSSEANAILILRTIEKEIASQKLHALNVFAHADSVLYILNKKREDIKRIEQEFGIELGFYEDKTATAESFYIEKIKLQQRKNQEPAKNHEAKNNEKLNDKSKKIEQPKPKLPEQPELPPPASEQADINNEEAVETEEHIEPKETERKARTQFRRRRSRSNNKPPQQNA